MVGAVGSDGFASAALALLSEGGIDLARVRPVDGPTGVALILVEAGGENVIVVIPGANGHVSESDAATLDFGAGDVLLLQLEVPVPAIVAAARRARAAGAPGFSAHEEGVEEQALAVAEACGATVITTLGADGVLAVGGGGVMRAVALPVDAVDAVGAGDTFCGYLAAGLSEGTQLSDALALAAAAGSLACTRAGAQPAIPFRAEVEAALASR
jgi:ribokinase